MIQRIVFRDRSNRQAKARPFRCCGCREALELLRLERLIAVFMVQAGPLRTHHRTLIRQLVYQAIAD